MHIPTMKMVIIYIHIYVYMYICRERKKTFILWNWLVIVGMGKYEVCRAVWQSGSWDRFLCCSLEMEFLLWETSVFVLKTFD